MPSPSSFTAPGLLALGLLAARPALAQAPLATAAIGDSLSLETTVRSVLDANPGLNALQQEVNQAQARLGQARTVLRPLLDGTASYTRVDPVVRLSLPGSTEAFAFQPNNVLDFHVGAQYTLLDFGRRNADIDLVRSRSATATDNLNVTRRDLAFAAAQNYYGILLAREATRVQEQEIASLRQHQREMQERVAAGVSTRFDVTTTQVRITQAQDRRVELRNQLRNQEVELARLLHRPAAEVLPVRGRLAYAPQAVDVAGAMARGFEQRPEIQLARDAAQTAVAQQRVAEATARPSLNVLAQAGAKNGYLVPDINQLRFNTVAGAQLSVPLYDGGRKRAQRTEAVAAVQGAQARLADTQNQVSADVRQAANNLQASAERYDLATAEISQAQEALTRAQDRYRYGVGQNLDVLDAETQLAQARLARLQALYNYTLGQYQLRRASGEQIWQ